MRNSPNTKPGEVIRDVMSLRLSVEDDLIVRSRDVCRWRDMVCEAAVLVEVDDNQAISVRQSCSLNKEVLRRSGGINVRIVPVFGLPHCIVDVLD